MITEIDEALKVHPLLLTRTSDLPVVEGVWSIEELMKEFGGESEEEALFSAARSGIAIAKIDGVYKSFVPGE